MSITVPFNAISEAGFLRCEPIISVGQMKTRYLFGADLSSATGEQMSEETLQHAINSAISYMEHKLDIIIAPTQFLERYDYRQQDYVNFNFLQLKKRPVSKLVELKAKFPTNRELVAYPEEWYVLEKESGQIQLSPVEGSFSGLIVTHGGAYVPLIYGARSYWPHLFEVNYIAGFEADKVPVIINEMIGLQAAIRIFEILGDMIIEPGISAETVSLDGATTSKQTTASAMFSGYSARIESYRKQLTEYIATAKNFYNGIPSIIL